MKVNEILESASVGGTSSGSVATVATPLGTQSRSGGSMLSGKYTTDATPNTPAEYKRKNRARRQFENSIGN